MSVAGLNPMHSVTNPGHRRILEINRRGWDRVASMFHGGTALPEYGPLAPTEDTLELLETSGGVRALELGCGSGHSLRYLAERGASELWGLDLSSVQIGFADETLDRKSTRLNSSHGYISYAVFCLKKKKNK